MSHVVFFQVSVSLADLLHAIHHPIQQTHHLIADKLRIVNLDEMATAHCGNGPNGLAFFSYVAQFLVVAAPCRVDISHAEGFWRVENSSSYIADLAC